MIDFKAYLWLAGMIGVAVILIGVGWHERRIGEREAQAQMLALQSQVSSLSQALKGAQENAQTTIKRLSDQSRIAQAAQLQASAAQADASRASVADSRLRDQLATLRKSAVACTSDTRSQPIGSGASSPIDVSTDVLSRADQAAGILATYADTLRVALRACVASYASLGVQ